MTTVLNCTALNKDVINYLNLIYSIYIGYFHCVLMLTFVLFILCEFALLTQAHVIVKIKTSFFFQF